MSMGKIVATAIAIAVALDAQAMPLGIRIAVIGRVSQLQAVSPEVPVDPEVPEEEEMPFAVELLDQNTVRVNGFLDDDECVSSLVIPDTIGGKAVWKLQLEHLQTQSAEWRLFRCRFSVRISEIRHLWE